jgi:GNAT superfamily N-acetyltransferase
VEWSALDYLTDVDQHDHVALVAFDAGSGAPVAVGRWIRLRDEPEVAEAAIAVGDEWQGRGIGTVMGHELARRALEEGVTTFSATALANNKPILEILSELGAVRAAPPVGGVVELRIDLTRGVDRGTPLRAALRGHAAGELAQPEPGST